jgi:GlpG protein
MRQIGTLPDEKAARALADYLLTLQIKTKLERESGGWEVWVCDEDQIARAREELAAFTANPADPRFSEARRAADGIRRAEEQADEAYRRRQVAFRKSLRAQAAGRMPVTLVLVAICLLVALLTRLGEADDPDADKIMEKMFIGTMVIRFDNNRVPHVAVGSLEPILQGQVWRLVTPIFLHFSFQHIAFNMLCLLSLGSVIEARRGSLRFLGIVLVTAVLSNLGEYYLGGLRIEGGRIVLHYHPFFGGMSGVIFGLFGYVWMKMRFEPHLGMGMSQQAFVLSLIWMVLCFTGLVGSIANGAHVCGLIAGMLLGGAPVAWRHFRGPV